MRALILLSVLVLTACPGGADDESGKPIPDHPTPDAGVISQSDAASDPITPDSGVDAGTRECTIDSECPAPSASCTVAYCTAEGTCTTRAAIDQSSCTLDGEEAKCSAGSCVARCGDGLLQRSRDEQCDDGNAITHDGCRSDCIIEELIGLGYSGGQCEVDSDCAPAGSKCETGVEGGSCVIACSTICADRAMPTTPVTFCIDKEVYEDRLGHALASEISDGVCVSKCEFDLFPATGCRSGLHCERRSRNNTPATIDEVCVPGAWSVGLELSGDGQNVIGKQSTGPQPAEPYLTLLNTSCAGVFGELPATLFRGLADTLLALGSTGATLSWERLCTRPSDLADVHDVELEIASGRAFRLVTTRENMHEALAAAIYGYHGGHRASDKGPLWTSRVAAVKDGSSFFLYADAATERPSYDPARGRHFALVDGVEWIPLDSELLPGSDYLPIKVDGTQRKMAQWALPLAILYLADMARAYLLTHGQPLGVGDISLPTGGDIDGHASHDVGTDGDIYLLTYPELATGGPDMENPELWVSQCSESAGVWTCTYYEEFSGAPEDVAAPGHVPAATLLLALGEYAYDHAGPTQFVQNDVEVLKPLRDRPNELPLFRDATLTGGSTGWPAHLNHVHIRW